MGSRVTKSNKANRTSASKIYDADGDGYADEHDLDRALLAVGYHMPQSELLRHRIAHDTDGDGRVSFAEYLNMEMDPLKLAIRERFFDYDVNYNGLITREELEQGQARLKRKLPEKLVEAMFEKIDSSSGEGINYNEFLELIFDIVFNV